MPVNLIQLLQHDPKIALVGATNNHLKYGNVILKNLLNKRFEVYPVNKKATSIEDLKSYKSLSELNNSIKIDLVVFVIPPKYTLEGLKDCKVLKLMNVWLQPGAGDEDTDKYLNENKFNFLSGECIMVESN